MKQKFIVLIVFFLMGSFDLFAQTPIRGDVVDASNGEPMFGVTVRAPALNQATRTDIDGKYELRLPDGTFDLEFRMQGMDTVVRKVQAAGSPVRLNIVMGMKKLDEVVVEGRAMNNTDASLLKLQKKSAAVSDGISAEAISKTPDNNAGDVIRRVTGITLVGGKYVFVRGLGERYSNTLFNGVPLPSPEPDKKVVPLDLFPAALLKNIVVSKTFIPEDSAEFSGGSVKLETKEYPDEFFLKVGIKSGYNNNTTFQNFRTYNGGQNRTDLGGVPYSSDAVGWDIGNRDRPSVVDAIPGQKFTERGQITPGYSPEAVLLGSLQSSNQWSSKSMTAPVNKGFDISTGNTFKVLGDRKLGVMFAVTYNNEFQFRREAEKFNFVGNIATDLPTQGANRYLKPVIDYKSKLYEETVSWGTIFNKTLEIANGHRIHWKNFLSVNNDKQVRQYDGINYNIPYQLASEKLNYIQRNLFNSQFGGDHIIPIMDKNTKLDWTMSYSEANRNQPNMRDYTYAVDPTAYANGTTTQVPLLTSTNIGFSSQFYSQSKDINRYAKFDYEIPFKNWTGLESKFKLGYSALHREREFSANYYAMAPNASQNLTGLAGQSVSSPYYYPATPELALNPFNRATNGFVLKEFTRATDKYEASQKLYSRYAQFDMPIVRNLRFIGGARIEDNLQTVRTSDPYNKLASVLVDYDYRTYLDRDVRKFVDPNYTNTNAKIANRDVLPSANFVYSLKETSNIRASYTQTITRPDFREMSPFEFTDIIGGPPVKGNADLRRTYIHNYDLRYEVFPGGDEFFAIGTFYKKMSDPIEKVTQVDQQYRYSYTNAKSAYIQGFEIEARRGLGIINDNLKRWSVGFNTFLIKSEVELNSYAYYQLAEFGIVNDINRPTSLSRPLQGQSPYVYNLNLRYRFDEKGAHTVTVLYNEFGKRLFSVGGLGIPDTYEKPVGMLDMVYSLKLFEKWDIKVAAKNITDTRIKIVQENPILNQDETVYSYRLGPTITFSAAYNF
jgi:hypothetical protein